MAESVRCHGCGIALQSENTDAPGYMPASALSRPDVVCRRCYRMLHYGEFSRQVVDPAAYEREISVIEQHPGLVLYVLDVFDLAGSIATGLMRVLRGSEVHLVVNKVDLLPSDVDSDRLARWIRTEMAAHGIESKGIHFVSANKGHGITALFDWLKRRKPAQVYVVGMANVGKSTLLNRLKSLAAGSDAGELTVSLLPGTTLGMVQMNWTVAGKRVRVADTPGLMRGDRLTDHLCPDCLHTVVPAKRLKPRIFQLDPGQSLFFGNVCRFDFEAGDHQPIVCYVSNDLVIHRTKLERADAIMADHADDILKVPCPECRLLLGPLQPVPVSTQQRDRSLDDTDVHLTVPAQGADLVLPGLGWISCSGRKLDAQLWLPMDLMPTVRPRLIGDLNRPQ